MKKRKTAKKKSEKRARKQKKVLTFPRDPGQYFYVAILGDDHAICDTELGDIENKVNEWLHRNFKDDSDGAELCRQAIDHNKVAIYKVYCEQQLDINLSFKPSVEVNDR